MLLDLMTTLNLRGLVPWLALGALGACQGERGGPAPEELVDLIATHCNSVEACGCEGELSAATCTEDLTDRWNLRVRGGEERKLQYDAECFDRLTADVERYGCAISGGQSPLCSQFCALYHGDQQLGSSCEAVDTLVSDCAQGLLCSEGTCVDPCTVLGGRLRDEPCLTDNGNGIYDDCAAGLVCDWGLGTCQPLGEEGEPCRSGNISCASGLTCNWESGLCVTAPGEGERCDNLDCADGFDCDWQDGVRFCVAEAGEGEDCSNTRCGDDLFCNDFNRCQFAPGADEQCLWGNICAFGLACDFDSNRCVTLPVAGEQCLFNQCAAGSFCLTNADDPEGTCTEPAANGEMCMGHSQCVSGYCPNGFCWPRSGAGDSCTNGELCAAGLVCNGQTCEGSLTRAPAACNYPGW